MTDHDLNEIIDRLLALELAVKLQTAQAQRMLETLHHMQELLERVAGKP